MGVQHRFILSGTKQQLVSFEREDVDAVQDIINRWQQESLERVEHSKERGPKSQINFGYKPARLTLLFIFLGFLGTALSAFGYDFIQLFTFWDFSKLSYLSFIDFNPWADIQNGQIWRLITPVFLHFGPVHIIFNALWIWYLGTQLEFNQGKRVTLALFLIIGVVSNSAQAFVSEAVIFGGLSGIVHGLFAYCWLWSRMNKRSQIQIPDALFIVITVLMLLSPLGIFDIIIGSEIADTAHISGYITGAICALLMRFLSPLLAKIN